MDMQRAKFTKALALFTAGLSIVMAGAMIFIAVRGVVTEAAAPEIAAQPPAAGPGTAQQTRKGAGA